MSWVLGRQSLACTLFVAGHSLLHYQAHVFARETAARAQNVATGLARESLARTRAGSLTERDGTGRCISVTVSAICIVHLEFEPPVLRACCIVAGNIAPCKFSCPCPGSVRPSVRQQCPLSLSATKRKASRAFCLARESCFQPPSPDLELAKGHWQTRHARETWTASGTCCQ